MFKAAESKKFTAKLLAIVTYATTLKVMTSYFKLSVDWEPYCSYGGMM